MKDLLPIVTNYVDTFTENNGVDRLAALIGGEAVIQHGFIRLTVDVDLLLFLGQDIKPMSELIL